MITAIVVVAALAAVGTYAIRRSRQAFKQASEARPPDHQTELAARSAAVRLTSAALRTLPSPPWRVVYEIGAERLTGAEHVLIGPAGAFAVTTTIDPLPHATDQAPDPVAIARAAMTRGGLDDALVAVRLASHGLLAVHWGGADDDSSPTVAGAHGVTHVDGRRLAAWLLSLDQHALLPSQIDLAWQAVVVGIGRPDPLA